jgi:hypothetical protein
MSAIGSPVVRSPAQDISERQAKHSSADLIVINSFAFNQFRMTFS